MSEAVGPDSAEFIVPGSTEPSSRALIIASCCSGSYLARKVVERYRELGREAGAAPVLAELHDIDRRFSDSETSVRLEMHVSGADVYVIQSLLDPVLSTSVDENYMALLIAARAFREHGASKVTAVLPYLAYGRQDKPTAFAREPTTARLMADLTLAAGVDRVVAWDPHCGQVRGFYGAVPVYFLEPLTLFLQEFSSYTGRPDVIAVAPDAGAAKVVTYFSHALGIKAAMASKFRPRPEEVVLSEIIGDFAGMKVAIVLDDVLSTGGTVEPLIRRLVSEKGIEEVHLAVSHNRCSQDAAARRP